MPRYFNILLLKPYDAFTQLGCIKLISPTATPDTPPTPALPSRAQPFILSALDGRSYGFASFGTPMTNMSRHSANIASNPSLYPRTFCQASQVPSPGLDEVQINSCQPPDVRAYSVNTQVDAKEYTLGLHPPTQSTLLQVICERARTLHPEDPFTGIPEESFPLPVVPISPSDSLHRAAFIGFTNSSLQGHEGVWSVVSLIPDDGINPIAVDDRNDCFQRRVPMNVSLDHNNRHTRVHMTSSSVSTPSTLSVISPGQTLEQDKEQVASTGERPNQQKPGRNLPVRALLRSSDSSLRPGEKRVAPQGRYLCGICKLDYTQPQGLKRHQREKHNYRLCMYCCEFAWGRPYLFREHLVKRHPGIDPNAEIIKATKAHQGSAIKRRYLQQQRTSIPADEHDNWGRTESQAYPNLLPSSPSTAGKHAPIFPPTTPSMTYDLQPKDDHTISPFTEEGAQPATNLNVSTRAVQIWFQERGKAASRAGFTAADSTSNLAPAPVLVPLPLASGYCGSPVIVSPMVEPSEHTYACRSSPALAMLRSRQIPSPSFSIEHGWADLYSRGEWGQSGILDDIARDSVSAL